MLCMQLSQRPVVYLAKRPLAGVAGANPAGAKQLHNCSDLVQALAYRAGQCPHTADLLFYT